MALTSPYICPIKIIEKYAHPNPENPKIKDVRNGCSEPKDISRDEKKGEIVCRHCGQIHSGALDRLDQDQSAGPGATDQRQMYQSHLLRPARAPVTPPRGPTATPKPVRYKAAPVSLKQSSAPTSSSSVQPPVKAPPVPPPGRSSGSTRQPSTPPDPPGPPKTPPPWRERSQQAEQRHTTRKRPINVPEPPAPPSRMTGTQWLDQGAASSSSGYRNYGYSYDQPAYYRVNPRTSNVEYVPGYQIPRQRWIQKYDGSWLDLIPQTPDQSIFFHLSGELRRRNEMNFYGYTFTMGL